MSFPVDDITLDLLDHALNGTIDDNGNITGADMNISQLLAFMSPAQDDHEIQRRTDIADATCSNIIDLTDLGWTYHRDDVIRALIAEIRRLRA